MPQSSKDYVGYGEEREDGRKAYRREALQPIEAEGTVEACAVWGRYENAFERSRGAQTVSEHSAAAAHIAFERWQCGAWVKLPQAGGGADIGLYAREYLLYVVEGIGGVRLLEEEPGDELV